MISYFEVNKIKLAYNAEHDVDPGMAPVTWRERLLLEMIEDLQEQINVLNEPESPAEIIQKNVDAKRFIKGE